MELLRSVKVVILLTLISGGVLFMSDYFARPRPNVDQTSIIRQNFSFSPQSLDMVPHTSLLALAKAPVYIRNPVDPDQPDPNDFRQATADARAATAEAKSRIGQQQLAARETAQAQAQTQVVAAQTSQMQTATAV